MEKIFVVVELPEEKKVNIETFYLIKLLEELSTQVYPITVNDKRRKNLFELISDVISRQVHRVVKICSGFYGFRNDKDQKICGVFRFYIRNQLASKPIQTYQELYE